MLQAVLSGIPLTLGVTFVALVIGTLVSMPLLAGTLSKYRIVWLVSRGVIDLLRGVPIVVWLFIFYYGVTIGPTKLSPFGAAVLGLGLVSGAYLAEILPRCSVVRGGRAVRGRGALSGSRTWTCGAQSSHRRPGRVAIPGYTTYGIGLLKDSSIASTIGVAEMVFASGKLKKMRALPVRGSRSSWWRRRSTSS